MTAAPQRPSHHQDPGNSPLLRIVWMGENGVNEQALNAALSGLADLATAGQSVWFDQTTGLSSEALNRYFMALEELRIEINQLTALLVEVLQVLNKQHAESFNFRFGQCIAEEQLVRLRALIGSTLNGLTEAPDADKWDLLRHGKMWINDWRDAAIPQAYIDVRLMVLDNPDTYDVEMTDSLRGRIAAEQFENINRIEQSAISKLEHITNAAGTAGAKSLAKGFSEQTDKEAARARWWTAGVVLWIVLGIAVPVLALTTEKIVFSTVVNPTVGTIIKALTALPFFALAAYFGRVSSQHRETERYLRVLTTQINTVQAYSDILPDRDRAHLINALGMRAFGDPGFTIAEKGKVSAIPDDVMELLKKAMEIAKDAGRK